MITKAADVTTMATASNAQREPSMEEILASIRKIIEDSDPIRKSAEDAIEQDQIAEARPTDTLIADMDIFRAELRGGLDSDAGTTEVEPALARGEHKGPPFAAPALENDPSPTLAGIGVRSAAGKQEAEGKSAAPVWPAPMQPAAPQKPSVAKYTTPSYEAVPEELEAKHTFAARDENGSETSDTASIPSMESPSSVPSTGIEASAGQTLVSEQTSRQVAASFGELSEAFASRSRKSLDEMAEDMLRPMLQDWLDNNLPTLVERLVREEIERVARGG